MLNKTAHVSEAMFSKKIESVPVRDGFGEGMVRLGRENPLVVALTADLKESTRIHRFAAEFPDRFIECGVSEQGMITVASGLANYGKIPFACSFAAFSPGRNWEQIRTTICLNDVPVKIAGLFVGVTVGADGATHQMLEDISLMRSLPNMIVVAPSDAIEARKAVIAAASINKPVYLRIPRVESPVYTTEETPFEIGKAVTIWEEKNPQVTIIAHGVMVYESLLAARELSKKGIMSIVINCHTIKPLDDQAIIHAAKLTDAVVVAEEHQQSGGLGGAISELLGQQYPAYIEIVGVADSFGQSGKPKELLERYGLTAEHIAQAARRVIKRKNS